MLHINTFLEKKTGKTVRLRKKTYHSKTFLGGRFTIKSNHLSKFQYPHSFPFLPVPFTSPRSKNSSFPTTIPFRQRYPANSQLSSECQSYELACSKK